MTLLKKRVSKDMAASPPPQAKRTRTAPTSDLLHNHALMQVLQHEQNRRNKLGGHGLSSTIDPVGSMDPAIRLPSQPTSPREPTAVFSNVVTPSTMSPQEALPAQANTRSLPRPLPRLPFKGSSSSNSRPRMARQNHPLDVLSSVSSDISNAPLKRQPRYNNVQPPKKKSHHVPQARQVPQAQALKSCLKPQAQPSKTDESYVGCRTSSGLRHGRGIMKYPNGCRYVGHFANDKRHGYGKVWYPNDMGIYTGYWRDNKRHGTGTMSFANGDVYEGQWMNDEPNGFGKLVMKKNCESYTGDFVNRQKHGIGIHVGPSGDVYKGEYFRDVRHGSGVLKFANNGATEIRCYCQGRLLRHDFVR